MLLPYLLLAASCQWDPLELAFIDLAKAYDWLPMATLWLMLAEELEVPDDGRIGIKALYYQTQSAVWREVYIY